MRQSAGYQVGWRRQKDSWWKPLVWYGFFLVATLYLIWRATIINWHTWYGPLMFLAELYGIITTGLFLFVAKKLFVPVKHEPTANYSVDALIPSYNEPIDVLEPVVLGATRIRGISNVLVLDDGNRPEIKAMAKRLKVKYYARTDNRFAKAGNMNNGLKHTSADLLITLDADHIPLPNFIEETIGFFDDPHLAFVQSPQTFYNKHTFLFRNRSRNRVWGEQTMFYDCLQPAKNNWNAAFFVGTSAILRRTAIDSVGGFATGTATEDIHTSLRLHAKGWQSIFLPQPLAYGLEAESFNEFYKQRRRWAAGSLGLLFRSSDSPLWARGLTMAQRLNYLSACMAHLQGVQKLCFILVPVVTIFTNVSPVSGSLQYYFAIFIMYLTVALSATWAYSRGTYHMLHTETYALANMFAHFGGILGIIKVQKKFAVSNKRARHNDGSRLILAMWLLAALAIIAYARAAVSFVLYDRQSMLVLTSLAFITVNGALLIAFLIKLRRYEKHEPSIQYDSLQPSAMYDYITRQWHAAVWDAAKRSPEPKPVEAFSQSHS